MMPENPKQKEGIESRSNARELESKQMDRIWARCPRTQNKTKGLNLGAMAENLNQNKEIESGRNAREPESKQRVESERDGGEPNTKEKGRI